MNKTETEDFNNAIVRYGYAVNDFAFEEVDTTPWNQSEGTPISGTILITFKKTGNNKKYQTGMGTKWPCEFEDDLQNGTFC